MTSEQWAPGSGFGCRILFSNPTSQRPQQTRGSGREMPARRPTPAVATPGAAEDFIGWPWGCPCCREDGWF